MQGTGNKTGGLTLARAAVALAALTALAPAPQAGAQAAGAQAQEQRSLRFYDLSDLLPAAALREQPWVDALAPLVDEAQTPFGAQARESTEGARALAPTVSEGSYRVFAALASAAIGVSPVRIAPNLALVQATDAEHRALAEAVEALRAAYARRVVATVRIRALPADAPLPRVGEALEAAEGETLFLASQPIRMRLPTLIAREGSQTIVESYTPVVGTGSSGLNPHIARRSAGMRLTLRVDAAGEGAVAVSLQGLLRTLQMDRRSIKSAAGQATASAELDLPAQWTDAFSSELTAPMGREVVAAALGGRWIELHAEDSALVATVRIDPQ